MSLSLNHAFSKIFGISLILLILAFTHSSVKPFSIFGSAIRLSIFII